MLYKMYDVEVTVFPSQSGATFETMYAIYRGSAKVFTGITPLEVTSFEHGERMAYSAARRWIDQQS